MPTINLITLGCPKNTVDSERMHHLLERNGYDLSDDAEDADIIVVNTCGFIEPAKEESIATVMDAAEYKKNGRCRGVIVTGCLAERYQTELETELVEADMIVGLAGERDIVAHCDHLLGTSRIHTIRDAEATPSPHPKTLGVPANLGRMRQNMCILRHPELSRTKQK